MPAKLYVVNGSHPCVAVQRALELKGIEHRVVELPPTLHFAIQRARFGTPTVPSIRFADGEKLSGSTAIMRRLDELVPEPKLFGDERVAEAEAWGESVLQAEVRRFLWRGFRFAPRALHSYQEGGKLPALPLPVVLGLAPVVTRVEGRMNGVTDELVRAELAEFPQHLDRIDTLIADGVIGGAVPNAADLQIASSLRLAMTVGDLAPLLRGRPAADLARRLFPNYAGELPAGTFPADWLPAKSASSAASVAG